MTSLRATAGVFAVGLFLFGAASPAHTQPVSMQAELLKDWLGLKDTMHKIAAEMPADKYSVRPTEAQQTFGERIVHIANVNVALLSALGDSATTTPAIDPKVTTKNAPYPWSTGQTRHHSR